MLFYLFLNPVIWAVPTVMSEVVDSASTLFLLHLRRYCQGRLHGRQDGCLLFYLQSKSTCVDEESSLTWPKII